MKGKYRALLWLLPFAVFYLAFQVAPLAWVAGNSFWSDVNSRWGLDNYHDILTSPFYLQAISFSLDISFWSSVYGLLISLVAGYDLRLLAQSKLHRFMLAFTNRTSNFACAPLPVAFIILLVLNG